MKKIALVLATITAISTAQAAEDKFIPMAFHECQRQVLDFRANSRDITGLTAESRRIGRMFQMQYAPILIEDAVVRFSCIENGPSGTGMQANKRSISELLADAEVFARRSNRSTSDTARLLGLGN